MIFAAWAARFVADRGMGRVAGTGTARQKPAGPGLAGFSAVKRSGVREAASRTGRKTQRGRGFSGCGHILVTFDGASKET